MCGMCGTSLKRQRYVYVCDGCGTVRVAAAPLEEQIVPQALTLMGQTQGWTRLVVAGAAEGEQPPAEQRAMWWNSVDRDGQRVLLGILVDYIQVDLVCADGQEHFTWITHPQTG
ncbi:hypothetical protein Psi01_74030 [Planobispora siamensis]|uniref:Uncharacterized protein n=1 Tax=Planobispora siamensis TaxID=936338 RepID=A0A8J3SLR3_9ACTN|nr:hypothetical protein Psi01_74030 [Planobispora siamensis]